MLAKLTPFLLTPLREGRQKPYRRCPTRMYFYSRPCGRGDADSVQELIDFIISTHAPAGGATSMGIIDDPIKNISTHAPAGGAT